MKIRLTNNKKQKISIQAIVLFIYFFIVPTDVFKIGVIGTVLKVFAIVVVGVFLLGGYTKIINDNILKYGILYLFICFASLSYSIEYSSSISILTTLLLNFGLLFVTCNLRYFNDAEVNLLHMGLILGSWFTVILTMIFSDFSERGRLSISAMGTVADQNYLNGYLFFAIAYSATQLILYGKKKFLHILSICICLFFTLYTGSRGALIAELAIMLVVYLTSLVVLKKKIKYAAVGILLCTGIIVIFDYLLVLLPPEISVRFSREYILQYGTSDRTKIWINLLNAFFNDSIFSIFFGHGIGTSATYNTFDYHVAHNAFIDILIGVGFVGLILYIMLISHCCKLAYKYASYELFACLIGFVVLSMSLSLITYKPIFNCIAMISITANNCRRKRVLKNGC